MSLKTVLGHVLSVLSLVKALLQYNCNAHPFGYASVVDKYPLRGTILRQIKNVLDLLLRLKTTLVYISVGVVPVCRVQLRNFILLSTCLVLILSMELRTLR